MKAHLLRRSMVICFLVILVISFLFAFTKIWGEKLLLGDWYRPRFILSEEISISEFGKANQIEVPLLKSASGSVSSN